MRKCIFFYLYKMTGREKDDTKCGTKESAYLSRGGWEHDEGERVGQLRERRVSKSSHHILSV